MAVLPAELQAMLPWAELQSGQLWAELQAVQLTVLQAGQVTVL